MLVNMSKQMSGGCYLLVSLRCSCRNSSLSSLLSLSQSAAGAEHQRGEMREIVHLQAGQCGNQIGAKVGTIFRKLNFTDLYRFWRKHHFFIK